MFARNDAGRNLCFPRCVLRWPVSRDAAFDETRQRLGTLLEAQLRVRGPVSPERRWLLTHSLEALDPDRVCSVLREVLLDNDSDPSLRIEIARRIVPVAGRGGFEVVRQVFRHPLMPDKLRHACLREMALFERSSVLEAEPLYFDWLAHGRNVSLTVQAGEGDASSSWDLRFVTGVFSEIAVGGSDQRWCDLVDEAVRRKYVDWTLPNAAVAATIALRGQIPRAFAHLHLVLQHPSRFPASPWLRGAVNAHASLPPLVRDVAVRSFMRTPASLLTADLVDLVANLGNPQVVPHLIACASEASLVVRGHAFSALGRMGQLAVGAVPFLSETMSGDSKLETRLHAADALLRIDSGAAGEAVDFVVDVFTDRETGVRERMQAGRILMGDVRRDSDATREMVFELTSERLLSLTQMALEFWKQSRYMGFSFGESALFAIARSRSSESRHRLLDILKEPAPLQGHALRKIDVVRALAVYEPNLDSQLLGMIRLLATERPAIDLVGGIQNVERAALRELTAFRGLAIRTLGMLRLPKNRVAASSTLLELARDPREPDATRLEALFALGCLGDVGVVAPLATMARDVSESTALQIAALATHNRTLAVVAGSQWQLREIGADRPSDLCVRPVVA
jgi:HEAT repeat protein